MPSVVVDASAITAVLFSEPSNCRRMKWKSVCNRMFEERRSIVGEFELATSFRFGGTPYDLAESGLRLYAKEVLPVVRAWTG